MIAFLGASVITLAALQASINAPTDAFRACLREASTKATAEKVGGDAIEAYMRSACTVQMDSLKAAVVAFRVKNGMGKKAAAEDADMTVEDYLASPVDKYKFMAEMNAPKAPAAAAPAVGAPAAQATPASAPPTTKQ
jgi:hypothetical protein